MIPNVQGKKGVLVSGGADSALLLYLLLQSTQEHLYIFTLASSLKGNSNCKYAIDVVSKCVEITNNQNFTHVISYCSEQTKTELFKKPNEFLVNGFIDWIYTGVTKNPPVEVTNKFDSPTTESYERGPDNRYPTVVHDRNLVVPFISINKKELANLYKQHNLTDILFPLTRSCEHLSEFEGHCGSCWWCEERKWGFGRLQ